MAFVLKQNDDKLKAFNNRRREYLKEYPEDAQYIKIIDSIDAIFTPYTDWLNSMTEKDRTELKIVPDGEHNFSGFYICADHNDHYHIEELTDYKEKQWHYEYGVVDNATQIIENCEIPENAVVLMTPVFKEKDAPPYCGWRWHKWGPYYGIQNHQCEHLNDEDDVEMIYCFTIQVLIECEGDENEI